MRTRTLLILSVVTALAILLAGGVLLLQLSNQEQASDSIETGEPATVGDLEITVFGATESGGSFEVDVRIAGVDDDLSGFGLATAERSLSPVAAAADGRCSAVTVEPQRCVLAFDTSADSSTSRVLVVRRGDEQLIWSQP